MDFEARVMATVKTCEERRDPPIVWAVEVAKCIQLAGAGEGPSPELDSGLELGRVLVSNLCFVHNNPSLWKFVEQGMGSGLLSPLQIIALLTPRVLPRRRGQPEAYRLYLELLNRYAYSFFSVAANISGAKLVQYVDDSVRLSDEYGIQFSEVGHVAVVFLFKVICCLIDCTLEDWGIEVSDGPQDMDIDSTKGLKSKRYEHREHKVRINGLMALEVAAKLLDNKKAVVFLRLVHLNMAEKFDGFLQRLQLFDAQKLASLDVMPAAHLLGRLSSSLQRALDWKFHLNKRQVIGHLVGVSSCILPSFQTSGAGKTASWVPFDIYMENAMDGKHFTVTSAIDILTDLTRNLRIINDACWQEAFQSLWIAALRLVNRERDPVEGPIPHLDARLCILLSLTPLAIARVVEEDGENVGYGSRRQGLISALQVLGQFEGLLLPPPSVVSAANNAASKAATFVTTSNVHGDSFGHVGHLDTSVKAVGSMLHLMVEACIARNLIDTSAYFWPGYVDLLQVSQTDKSPGQPSPWSIFREDFQLNGPLTNILMTNPASNLAEVEKIYYIALNGSDEEKSIAAKILCGATLSRGWNIQEYAVHFAVKLLSPPVPANFSGPGSHLVAYTSMLAPLLMGLSSFDIVHILSLYGVVPEAAASLLPICEVFGSLVPTTNSKPSSETSVYTVFSCAFLFLLRLWKFYRLPHENSFEVRGGAMGSTLNLEYLLLLRNSRIGSHSSMKRNKNFDVSHSSSVQPVYVDSYPKLHAWYAQNQACIASTVSGSSSGNLVANQILNMMFSNMNKSTLSNSNPSSSGNTSGSSLNGGDDISQRPILPAWEILTAVPFVLEAVLTACAHGRLSSRDLTTGLRDLVDFLPASMAVIISYFSAEVTRGIWKPVPMNGTDWPSPAANLLSVESEIIEMLGSVGVTTSNCYSVRSSPPMLPLPMAALVSLTITFKLDKSLEYVHGVAGPALETCASGCPWPSMYIVGALWAQKVRRWHDFIVGSCARAIFKLDHDSVAQLLRNCFSSFLKPQSLSNPGGGVCSLLGTTVNAQGLRGNHQLAPGFVYLRSCRTLHSLHYVNDLIVNLVGEYARQAAAGWSCSTDPNIRYGQTSLAPAAAIAKEVAMVGTSLMCATGSVPLVQVLYQETMPTWLLSTRWEKVGSAQGPASLIMEGYALAYLVFLGGSFVWGVSGSVSAISPFTKSFRVFAAHMDFIAGVIDGNILVGRDPVTWKAYVSCFVGLVVSFTPVWIRTVKPETLRKVANGLRGWHETELALGLLERGGDRVIATVVELFM